MLQRHVTMPCTGRASSRMAFAPATAGQLGRPLRGQQHVQRRAGLRVQAIPVHTIGDAEGVRGLLQGSADYFNTLNLPEPLVHWGHPGNMMVVLLAMGGYGALALGWQIRLGGDEEAVAKAKDAHPKLALGMFIFFALGAVGGLMSLIMQDKPIFESPHAISGMVGLALLTAQATLPAFFGSIGGSARDAHAYLGTATLALFLVHAGLGLKLGLSI